MEDGYQDTITGESPVLDTELIIKKYWDGGHKKPIDELPGEDDVVDLRETSSEVGKPEVDYPREGDHFTVEKYTGYIDGRCHTEYKVFDIHVSREDHPEEAERIENLLTDLYTIPEIEEELNEVDDYRELEQHSETVREYESLYGVLKNIWDKDTLANYATREGRRRPPMFEVDQFPHGFYGVPRLFHSHADEVIGEKLQEENLGKHSVVWGSFIAEPEDFSEVHALLKPFYHTPEDRGDLQ